MGVVIKIGVQFSGIDAIFYYSTLMFRHANVPDPQLATTLLSLVNLTMTFIAMAIMEKAGDLPRPRPTRTHAAHMRAPACSLSLSLSPHHYRTPRTPRDTQVGAR